MLDLSISYPYTSDEHKGVKGKGSERGGWNEPRFGIGQGFRQVTGSLAACGRPGGSRPICSGP